MDDDRVRCVDCEHFVKRNWRCVNARAALLMVQLRERGADVGPALSELPQRCPGFKAKPQ